MNNTSSLDQIQKTGELNADLMMRQYKLDKITKIMEIKPDNPKLRQSEIAKMLELSSSPIQQYRTEINMLSPCRLPPSSKTNHTRKQKTPNKKLDDVKVIKGQIKLWLDWKNTWKNIK